MFDTNMVKVNSQTGYIDTGRWSLGLSFSQNRIAAYKKLDLNIKIYTLL